MHYKELGARGVGEFCTNLRLDDPKILHLLGSCESLDMPFLFHMSPKENAYYGVVDFAGLPLLEKVLKEFPNLKVVGHSRPFWFEIGTHPENVTPEERNSFPSGPIAEGRLQELFRKYQNLYGDLSAMSGSNALMRDPDYGVAFMNEFQDRLLFGTDMLNPHFINPLGQWLDVMMFQRKLSETAYLKICRENAEKLYKL
jgi:predicted TIM-barrel fold metal-dependent hydrolase